jgi:hypothetical protein
VTYRIDSAGRRILFSRSTGVFYRSSEGNERREVYIENSAGQKVRQITLTDLTRRGVFRINDEERTASQIRHLNTDQPIRFAALPPPSPDQLLGDEIIHGLMCKKVAARDQSKGINVSWISFQHDLIVKSEMETTLPNGERAYMVNQIKDIVFGDPPAELMSLPSSYTIIDGPMVRPVPQCQDCKP